MGKKPIKHKAKRGRKKKRTKNKNIHLKRSIIMSEHPVTVEIRSQLNSDDYIVNDLSHEDYREYDIWMEGAWRTYRIENPATLVIRKGGSTHRIADTNRVVHCVPKKAVLRWSNPVDKPVMDF